MKSKQRTASETGNNTRPSADQELEVLQKLVVKEEDVIKGLHEQVEKARKIFSIASPGGKVIFEDFGNLNNKQRILVLLLGKYFALRLKLVDTAELGISEIAVELGRPKTTLSSDVTDLLRDGFIERLPDRTYKIAYNRVKEIFSIILPPERPLVQKVTNSTLPSGWATDINTITDVFPGLKPVFSKESKDLELGSQALANRKDSEAILLTLGVMRAFPPGDLWMNADQIIDWARNHGSPMQPETVKKWTLPMDTWLQPLIVKRKSGRTRQYQLSRLGIQQAKRLLDSEAARKVEGDS